MEDNDILENDDIKKEEDVVEDEETSEDDDEFLKSLEDLDEDVPDDEDEEQKKQRQKNKNAEEARKRREAEAKKKKEEEQAKVKEEEKPQSEEPKEEKISPEEDVQRQIKELTETYPDLDLNELDNNQDFQKFKEGKWYQGGKTITQIYNDYVSFTSRLSKQSEDEIQKTFKKKSTPSLKSSSGDGGITSDNDVFSPEEMERLSARLPFMKSKDYAKIEKKLDRSISFYNKQK